jgi:hypothetical protein
MGTSLALLLMNFIEFMAIIQEEFGRTLVNRKKKTQ